MPRARGSLPTQIIPRDVEIAGRFVLLAEQLFPNVVALSDISNPDSPTLQTIDFSALGDYAGTGIAVSGPYVYMTGESVLVTAENGTSGDTRLFIGQYTSREDRNGIAPSVALTAPANNSSVVRGGVISLRANSTDDVAVAAVTFSVNGVDIGGDTSEPYEWLYTVPANATSLTIRAIATDLGGNTTQSAAVSITAIADPMTTVTGSVLGRDSTPISGAQIDCLGTSGASDAGGRFAISAVSTGRGDIVCSATATLAGWRLVGSSQAIAPVRGGVTNVGSIRLEAQPDTIAAGYHFTCALTSAGGIKCWGDNSSGQLGNGTTTSSLTARDVPGLTTGVQSIVAGASHACALTSVGGVKCWGNNEFGQLGDGTTSNRLVWKDVVGLSSGVRAIAAGFSHTCALTDAGALMCWGDNLLGQLGDGTLFPRATPKAVVGLSTGVNAMALGYRHSCALTSAGGAKCWGYNETGQLGDGTVFSTTPTVTPRDVVGLSSGLRAITAGGGHTCVLTIAGGAKCWGANNLGQLGNRPNPGGFPPPSPTPTDVVDAASGITAISAGNDHTCLLTDAGAVKCTGWNYYGQLGDGTNGNYRQRPIDVVGLSGGVIAIKTGQYHTCARVGLGVKCWGMNWLGQIGDGTDINIGGGIRPTPTDVIGF